MKFVVGSTLVILSLILSGCGPKTIDGKSEAAYKKSLEVMSASLSPEDQKVLASSITTVAMQGTNFLEMAAAPSLFEQRARAELNGLTFAEIAAKAKAIEAAEAAADEARRLKAEKQMAELKAEQEKQAERAKAERKKQIESELAELSAAKAKTQADAEMLKRFIVQRSRFYFVDTSFRKEGVIELTVKNELPAAVSRAYFTAVLSSPGRSIPWVAADFNYTIAGGLEPGETVTWKLSPNMFSEWSHAPSDRNDLIFTVQLVKVDGANKEALYDSEFSERKQKRMETLQDSLNKGDFEPPSLVSLPLFNN